MYPLIIATIAADQLRERHERAARARLAREVRQRKSREAHAARQLSLHRALRLVRA